MVPGSVPRGVATKDDSVTNGSPLASAFSKTIAGLRYTLRVYGAGWHMRARRCPWGAGRENTSIHPPQEGFCPVCASRALHMKSRDTTPRCGTPLAKAVREKKKKKKKKKPA